MIPYVNDLGEVSDSSLPTKTFYIDFENNTVSGTVTGSRAVAQAARLILETERYQHIIYSYQYGVELLSLFGRPADYVCAEIKRRMTDALCQDDRITGALDFQFEQSGKTILVLFTIQTIYGELTLDYEIVI